MHVGLSPYHTYRRGQILLGRVVRLGVARQGQLRGRDVPGALFCCFLDEGDGVKVMVMCVFVLWLGCGEGMGGLVHIHRTRIHIHLHLHLPYAGAAPPPSPPRPSRAGSRAAAASPSPPPGRAPARGGAPFLGDWFGLVRWLGVE